MEPKRKWICFFAMGTALGKYFCRFEATTEDGAERRAWRRYPTEVVRIVPDDSRAEMNIQTYGKIEIPFGATVILTAAEIDDESLGRD